MASTMTAWWRRVVLETLQSVPTWRARAACAGADPELFHRQPEEEPRDVLLRYDRARAHCAVCPVQRDCLLEALVREDSRPSGVWGGTTPNERRSKSKHPRVVEARAAIAGVMGGPWVNALYVDEAAVLRRSEGEDVPAGKYERPAAVVRCVTSGRTFEETAEDLRMRPGTVMRSWTRSRMAAEANGDPVPQSPNSNNSRAGAA
jgi:WhiB family redox-sensing transcriptional regulator